jgi:hypothetical protein
MRPREAGANVLAGPPEDLPAIGFALVDDLRDSGLSGRSVTIGSGNQRRHKTPCEPAPSAGGLWPAG